MLRNGLPIEYKSFSHRKVLKFVPKQQQHQHYYSGGRSSDINNQLIDQDHFFTRFRLFFRLDTHTHSYLLCHQQQSMRLPRWSSNDQELELLVVCVTETSTTTHLHPSIQPLFFLSRLRCVLVQRKRESEKRNRRPTILWSPNQVKCLQLTSTPFQKRLHKLSDTRELGGSGSNFLKSSLHQWIWSSVWLI